MPEGCRANRKGCRVVIRFGREGETTDFQVPGFQVNTIVNHYLHGQNIDQFMPQEVQVWKLDCAIRENTNAWSWHLFTIHSSVSRSYNRICIYSTDMMNW